VGWCIGRRLRCGGQEGKLREADDGVYMTSSGRLGREGFGKMWGDLRGLAR
jgi:hypothetical protein